MNTVKNKHFEGTHKLIMDTFRTLVISKHNKISVKDICDVSGINRSTFYAHFEDIDTLMDGVMLGLFIRIYESSEAENKNSINFISVPYLIKILEAVKENKEVFSYCLANTGYYHMKKNTDILIKEVLLPMVRKFYDVSEEEIRYYYDFISAGFIAVINRWTSEGCRETPEKVSRMLYGLIPVHPTAYAPL